MNLTPKQKTFADEYIKNGGNASVPREKQDTRLKALM